MARSAATGRKKKATKTAQKEAEAPADESMTSQDGGEDVQEDVETGAVGGEEMVTEETPATEGDNANGDQQEVEVKVEAEEEEENDDDDDDGMGGGGFVVDAGDDDDDDDDDDADGVENKQIKRKMDQAIARKAKRYKVEEPMRVNVYMSRTERETQFNEAFKSFLAEKEIEATDVTKNDHKIWDLFAILEFQKEEDKAKLMSLSGAELGDRKVKFEDIKENNIDGLKAPAEEVLFVGNLPKTTTKGDLQELFPPAKEIFFPMSKHGEKRGFAFLVMESTAVVEEQIEAHKEGLVIEGFELVISKYTPKKKTGLNPVPGKKVLFIGNMNYNTTKETLREFFDDCESARILVNPQTKRSKGVGFLEFRTHKDAKKALKTHNGAVIDDREIFLEYADHEPKPQTQERFSSRGGGGGMRGGRGRGNFGGGYSKNQSGYGGGYGGGGGWGSGGFGNRGNYGGDGYGYGGQMGGYGGGGYGGMGGGGGYKNFGGRGGGGGGGGYNQRFQRGGNFKNNRGNRGRY